MLPSATRQQAQLTAALMGLQAVDSLGLGGSGELVLECCDTAALNEVGQEREEGRLMARWKGMPRVVHASAAHAM